MKKLNSIELTQVSGGISGGPFALVSGSIGALTGFAIDTLSNIVLSGGYPHSGRTSGLLGQALGNGLGLNISAAAPQALSGIASLIASPVSIVLTKSGIGR